MNNNDILVRLRYALDLKDFEMVKVFELGEVDVTKEEIQKLLVKSIHHDEEGSEAENDEYIVCDDATLESFLNGLIVYKRGKPEVKPGEKEVKMTISGENINNVVLKKVKIALALTSDDILDIFSKAGISISKGELSAVLRKEGHRNYKECGDRYVRNFLKGLAIKYRK